ncbi:hypothetical protein [Acinetobacter sp. YH01009]|uniref:hypothetical protein n=1 Tax=Acinetobacter sp. YH01009 TaxID=2601025 RepID=UPI0015D43407|nr:hypothetical protein [Acinetobacter sp. YH01009]
MKLLKIALAGMLGSIMSQAVMAADDIETQSPNFKEAYVGLLTPSKNFKVLGGGLMPELSQYNFSDSYFENNSNQRYKATYHLYQQMNPQQRAMYLLLQHTSYLNDIFYPQRNPLTNPDVTAEQLNIESAKSKLEKFRTDNGIVEKVVDRETMLQALKAHYDYYMRDQFTVRFYGKNQEMFTYGVDNFTGLNIRTIEGNFRVVDRKTGTLLGDSMIKLNHWVPGNRAKEKRTINIPSTMPEWKDVSIDDLAIKFQPTAITTMRGKRIDINQIYLKNTQEFNF